LVEARDGNEAIEQARQVHPDLILLDMMMPGQSGLEVLAELRRDPELRGIPVVMLTARAQSRIERPLNSRAPTAFSPSRSARSCSTAW